MANRLLQAGTLTFAGYLIMVLSQAPVHPIALSLEQPPLIAQISSRIGDCLAVVIDRTRFN